jgi:TetR/AcrR family transcriptional regulator, cholesterol catabolism regulator
VVRSSNARSILASPRRQRRRDDRRAGILRAAAQTFRERGFADTGMRDIALSADLSPANLYHYFRGKDEILYYCQDRALDRMLKSVADARRRHTDAVDRLAAVLDAHLHTLVDEVGGATAHLETRSLSPRFRSRIVRKRDRYEHAVRRIVVEGMAERVFVQNDAAIVTRAMLGALNWTVTWFRPGGLETSDTVAQSITALLVRGLSAAPGRSRHLLALVPPRTTPTK